MNNTITQGQAPDTGLITIPEGVHVENPLTFNARSGYKKIIVTVHDHAQFTCSVDGAIAELTIIALKYARCQVRTQITSACTQNIKVCLDGEYACVDVVGLCAVHSDDRVKIDVRQEHHAAHSVSTVEIRTVVGGTASVEHHGMIFVAQAASGTQVRHHNKTILLSRGSWLNSSPDLEVLQQNVQCSHGTAVGPLDEEQVLYLCSRGITRHDAQRMLLNAFLMLLDEKKTGELQGLITKVQEMV